MGKVFTKLSVLWGILTIVVLAIALAEELSSLAGGIHPFPFVIPYTVFAGVFRLVLLLYILTLVVFLWEKKKYEMRTSRLIWPTVLFILNFLVSSFFLVLKGSL